MKVRRTGESKYFTIGRVYDVFGENPTCYLVEDDEGDKMWDGKKEFEVVSEEPDRITALEEANGQLTDRLIKLEKEVSEIKYLKDLPEDFVIPIEKSGRTFKATFRKVSKEEDLPRELSPKPYELHTNVEHYIGHTELRIIFYDENKNIHLVGEISCRGECKILNRDYKNANYNLWREKGMLVCSDPVEWRGKEYFIDTAYNEVTLSSNDEYVRHDIYDFKEAEAWSNCLDDNIIRHKHNNRPILF